MKKLLYPLLTVIFMACGADEESGVKIIGKVQNIQDGQYVYLQALGNEGFINVDSVKTQENGDFQFLVTVSRPDFYRVNLYGRQSINLILSGDEETVNIEAHGTDPNGIRTVSGSTDTDLLLAMDSLAIKRNSDFQLLNQEAMQARSSGNSGLMRDIQDQYYYLLNRHNDNMKGLIWGAVPSLAALYGINYINIEQDFKFADSLVQVYRQSHPEHPLAKDLYSKVDGMRTLAIGQNAPDISLPAPNGDIVKLSSLKGNYVLIDFWAAWCRPCRMENPNVVRLYNKYKDRNFEIFGVSLDRKREAWLKAIEDDGLIWKHVSDLKYFNSEAAKIYQIDAIPATYLIDPEGKIMAKGLRAGTLKAKLEEIFG